MTDTLDDWLTCQIVSLTNQMHWSRIAGVLRTTHEQAPKAVFGLRCRREDHHATSVARQSSPISGADRSFVSELDIHTMYRVRRMPAPRFRLATSEGLQSLRDLRRDRRDWRGHRRCRGSRRGESCDLARSRGRRRCDPLRGVSRFRVVDPRASAHPCAGPCGRLRDRDRGRSRRSVLARGRVDGGRGAGCARRILGATWPFGRAQK